ncbi:MAG: class II glutamine amidotransferase [Pseudomonadota bacterium]
MCELLGMSANVPTDIRFSFTGLVQRGGRTGPHRDGWGVAFYEDEGCRSFHDPAPSIASPLARLLSEHPIKSRIVIAHVRRANRGRVALCNTHPFSRELWGRAWSLAHNGQIKGAKKLPLDTFRPLGSTDSEHALCWLLDQLKRSFGGPPAQADLDQAVDDLFGHLRGMGVFNALLSDGRSLFASCSTRLSLLTRRAPFGQARLVDDDVEIDFAAETTPNDIVTIIATRPLTRDETWRALQPNSSLTLRHGEIVVARAPHRSAKRVR